MTVTTTETLEGTITVTIPSIDAVRTGLQSSSAREEIAYGDVYVDGVNVGHVSSAAPSSFRVSVGIHRINVISDDGYEYGYKQIDVQFGKPNPVTYDRDVLATSAQKNAQAKETQTGLLTFSGTGDNIYKFTVNGAGAFIISSTYSGSSNFIVEIDDQYGQMVELPVNKIGSYNGKDLVSLDKGVYFLSVKSSGPFTVQVAPS